MVSRFKFYSQNNPNNTYKDEWSHLETALGCSRVVWVKHPCQGDTPQLSSGGLSGDELSSPRCVTGVQGSCKYNCYRPPGWSRTAVSWRAIAGFTGKSAIKETCNTLTNGYTAVAKLTMTPPPFPPFCCLARVIM